MLKTHKIFFNSKDRITGTSTNLKYNLASTIPNVVSLSITNFRMPITYYNITSKNNVLKFRIAPAFFVEEKEIKIEVKNYSATELASAVKTAIDTLLPGSAPHSVNYNSNTGKFTLDFLGMSFGILTGGLGSFLGFSKDTELSVSAKTSDVMANLSPEPVYLATDIQLDSEVNQNLMNIMYSISGAVSFGSIYKDNDKTEVPIELLKQKNLSNLTLRLVDGDGDEIDNNGVNYSMVLTLYYVKANRNED